MKTFSAEEWALVISIIAIFISGSSFWWTIYKDTMLTARLKLRFALGSIYHPAIKSSQSYFSLSVTNRGPGKINLNTLYLKEEKSFRRTKFSVLVHDYENPLSAKLPLWLNVGESASFYFRPEICEFLNRDYTHLGIIDSFGKKHWSKAKEMRLAKKLFKKKFGKTKG